MSDDRDRGPHDPSGIPPADAEAGRLAPEGRAGAPLYRTLSESLLRQVRSGRWQPGERIPSERDLVARTGLSRDTVRKGIADLERRGVLQRRPGMGTYVAAPQMRPHLVALVEALRLTDHVVGVRPAGSGRGEAPDDVRQALGLSPDGRVVWLQRLLTVDGATVGLERSYLPGRAFADLIDAYDGREDLAALLAEIYGVHVTERAASYEPVVLGAREAFLLGVRAGLPALLLEYLGLDAEGRRVLFSSGLLRGDCCREYGAAALGAWEGDGAAALATNLAALRDAERDLRCRSWSPSAGAAVAPQRPPRISRRPISPASLTPDTPRRAPLAGRSGGVSRRQFLRMTGLAAAGVLAAGGLSVAAGAPVADAPIGPRRAYREAPDLAERVAADELPSVEQRLPANPSLYPVTERIGRYGGTIRRAFAGPSDFGGASKWVATSLTHFNPDLSLRPDLCEAWEVDDEATTYTIHLRPGLRWSDGTPFTSEDVRWWYDEVVHDAALTPSPLRSYSTGEPPVLMALDVPDAYTVVMRFAHPFPVFMHQQNTAEPFLPAHYMRQFHMRCTADRETLQEAVTAAGCRDWGSYFWERNKWYLNPDRPVLYPWRPTNTLESDLFVLERNPCFCGVDEAGQQLPYVDRVTFRRFASIDTLNMWILNGEIDLQGRHVDIGHYALFKANERLGGYRVDLWRTDDGITLGPNHDCKDPRLKVFFGRREVRQALNLAVDRDEINRRIYHGMGVPRQASPSSWGPHYHAPATEACARHDLERANRLLDEAGYAARDAEGYRLWDDGSGEPIAFTMETWEDPDSSQTQAGRLLTEHLARVGIRVTLQTEDRALYEARSEANDIQAAWQGGGHYTYVFLKPDDYFTGEKVSRVWAGGWGLWKLDHDDPNGDPPPEGHWLWDIWDISDRARMETDEARRIAAHRRIMDIWAREVPVVGVVGELPGPVIVKDGIGNFSGCHPFQTPTNDDALLGSPVYFWDEPA
ncbi:MAG: UTRA domain-containing protein [Chloroflexi bacterium]|nr:UTRA domain-containing protein [Chloroflexota bacterium]